MNEAETRAFIATTPFTSIPVSLRLAPLVGRCFDRERNADGSWSLVGCTWADFTPIHIVTDLARIYYEIAGRPVAWKALADRCLWPPFIDGRLSDSYGEALGVAASCLWAGNAVSMFQGDACRDEIRALILSLVPSPSGPVPTPTPVPAPPFPPVEQHGPVPDSNFAAGRSGHVIDRILLHTMVGWISAADARFRAPGSGVSAHFGVRVDGALWQWVNIWDTAYHAGDLGVNYRSIGIEHEDEGDPQIIRPDALYARSAALVAQFCKEYSIPIRRGWGGPGIYDHRQIVATGCPDGLDTDRIICEARKL